MTSYRVVFAGGPAIGKTALILRRVKESFTEFNEATVGSDQYVITQTVTGPSGTPLTISLILVDTAGQEKFRSMAPFFFREANVVVLCYDISEKSSLEAVREFRRKAEDGAPAGK
jgi:small GTP-binding protein